jgi:uncharacterized protein YwgA
MTALPQKPDKTDLILLLLAAPTTDPAQQFRCNGITRLEKLLFLLEHEFKIESELSDSFDFEPYHYGPYSKQVYDAVDLLRSLKLLSVEQHEVHSGLDLGELSESLDRTDIGVGGEYIEQQVILTESGKAVAKVLSRRLSESGKQALTTVKQRYGAMPLRQLLRYVYDKYENYTVASRIKDSL